MSKIDAQSAEEDKGSEKPRLLHTSRFDVLQKGNISKCTGIRHQLTSKPDLAEVARSACQCLLISDKILKNPTFCQKQIF